MRTMGAIAGVGFVLGYLVVWALCRAAATGDRMSEEVRDEE